MTYIERNNGFGRIDRFEVVDKVPADYRVWNVPLDWMGGYVPFCQCYEDTCMVNLDTLKAIKIDDYAVRKQLHDASGLYGIYNLRRARISINGVNVHRKRVAEGVLRIYEVLTE